MSSLMSQCKKNKGLRAKALLAAAAITAAPSAFTTDLSTVPLPTYSAGSTTDIKPNILFVLDDSGSMDWNFLPDWADNAPPNASAMPPYLFRNASFNGVAYNPAVTYSPPVRFNADGTKDTTTYPSMTGQSAATGANTDAKPNWKAVKNDGYGVQSTGTTNLVNNAYFFTTIAGEYCNSPALTNCTTSTVPTGNYQYAAPLRWCNSNTLGTCRALQDNTYKYPRMAAPRVATITFSNSTAAVVTGVTVGGQQILSGSTTASDTSSEVATRVRDRINACQLAITGNCTVAGYYAFVSDRTVTIFAPGAISDTPAVTNTGATTISTTAFGRAAIPLSPYLGWWEGNSGTTVPGENLFTTITSTVNSYPHPGTAAKATTRTDCQGTTCTYEEEMTNYANWWAYYRTRMQMMKTSTSRAFATLDSDADIAAGKTRFRVGYLTLNNNTGTDFVNITEFDTAQKVTWFSKLQAARPTSGTPLRDALAKAGRLYGGKYNGSQLNGVDVVDPLQYSCQKNFTILSTDGYWNGSAGAKLDGATAIGNQDGVLPRPYNDGATAQNQQRTSQLQTRTNTQRAEQGTLQRQLSQIQSATATLQSRAGQLQNRTSNNGGATWTGWSNTNSCTPDNTGSSRRECRVDWGAWTNAASCSVDNSGGSRMECQYVLGAWANAASCTDTRDPGPNYTGGTETACQIVLTQAYANSPTCTPGTDGSGVITACQYSFAATAPTQTCTPAYTAGDYTNATVYRNCATTPGSWNNTATCTATTVPDASGNTTSCQYTAWTGWSNVGSCTAVAQSSDPNYTEGVARECQVTSSGGTSNTLADVAAYYYYTDLRSSTATGVDATGTCTGPIIPPATTATNLCTDNVPVYGRDTNTKQHMTTHTLGLGVQGMMVYSPYQNNLAGQRVYVPDYWNQQSGDFYDVANASVANAASGICPWISTGNCVWPTPSADSAANIDDLWHAAVNGHGTYFSARDPQSLSDSLRAVLSEIVKIPRPGTAAAAASSNPNVTSSDNYVFSSSYLSLDWFGELVMQRINPDGSLTAQQWSAMQLLDCAVTPWQANRNYAVGEVYNYNGACYAVNTAYSSGAAFAGGAGADAQNTTVVTGSPVTRTIYTAGSTGLVPFTWAGLSSAQKDYFSAPYINYASATSGLSQFCSTGPTCLSAAAQTAGSGQALVNFLRGDRTNEGSLFRTRKHVLGDIVSSEARYVKTPLLTYADSGYAAFKTAMATRAGTVYVGSNDGMLHAFDADSGQERWAFVPSAVLPEMYRLADIDYTNKHRFFVDGTPEVGDICPNAPSSTCSATQWRTILVGGLNLGGKAFYALDITDPASPTLLWEFTNAGLGYSYSNPRITKLRDGTWVVIVASGYNNTDGVGRLFVLNAATGALIRTISTGVGTAASPSGLARISARAPLSATDNTVEQVYGGDVLGNVWRFDVNNTVGAAGYDAHLLVTLKDDNGNAQPITARPTVASINGQPLLLVGTGRFLGINDLTDTQVQSVYGIKDKLDAVTLPDPRATGSNFVEQTLTDTTCPSGTSTSICSPGQIVRTSTNNTVDWSVKNGWYVDFVVAGERAATDATLALGTLAFTTVVPQSTTTSSLSCTADSPASAKSYLYYMNYLTGGAVEGTNGVVGEFIGDGTATRPSIFRNQDGTVRGIIRLSGAAGTGTDMGGTIQQEIPTGSGSSGVPSRKSWRILNGD